MPDPLPTTAARLVTLQVALLRTALAAPPGGSLRADLTSAAQWAVWAGGRRPAPVTRSALASLLDATNRLIAEVGDDASTAMALRNVLFPAQAGMNRCSSTRSSASATVPRPRGDEPIPATSASPPNACSPPTRG